MPDYLNTVEDFVAGQDGPQADAEAVAVAVQVRDQDVDLSASKPTLRRGVAKDRRISVEDDQMRHGRKSRTVRSDGYKRHILRDLDTGLVSAVGITPANVPEATVTDDIEADLHVDPQLTTFCKAWRVRNTTGRYTKAEFTIDFETGQLTCPNQVSIGFTPGKSVRSRKTPARPAPTGTLHHQHNRPQHLHPPRRAATRRATRISDHPAGRGKLRERVKVEHGLAHVGHWQGPRARYRGTRKNLFDLRRVAVVHNLHVIARQPTADTYQLAA